jgi:hypothetical protein
LLALASLAAGCGAARSETDLDQAIPPFESQDRPLQVVIHDLLETAPRGGAVRVCRALAGKAVRLETEVPLPLGEILERLAGEVGSDLAPAARGASGPALPTLRCPGEVGDHLVIGRLPG